MFDSARILDKYEAKYYICSECGFIQTEDPFWLSEAYESAITSTDVGLLWRNIMISKVWDVFFLICCKDYKSYLDYGGGYGVLVRLMRDKGYDFEWYDEYCENIFAKTHEMKKGHYDVVTAFEMLEHLPDPIETLDNLFMKGDALICTTNLIPSSTTRIEDWWYFGTKHGQHISFYTSKSMRVIAKRYQKKYYRIFNFHFFTEDISWPKFMIVKLLGGALVLSAHLRLRCKSLMTDDHNKAQNN